MAASPCGQQLFQPFIAEELSGRIFGFGYAIGDH